MTEQARTTRPPTREETILGDNRAFEIDWCTCPTCGMKHFRKEERR